MIGCGARRGGARIVDNVTVKMAQREVVASTRNDTASCRVSVHQVRNFTAYMCCLGHHPQAHLRWIVRRHTEALITNMTDLTPLHFTDSGLEGQRNVATTGELMSAISPMLPRSDSSPSP